MIISKTAASDTRCENLKEYLKTDHLETHNYVKILKIQIILAYFGSLQVVLLADSLGVIIRKNILEMIFCPKVLPKDDKIVGHKAKLPFHILPRTLSTYF